MLRTLTLTPSLSLTLSLSLILTPSLTEYQAEMWSVERVIKVLVVINARGFHVYRLVGVPTLLCSFNFETLVSWQAGPPPTP